MSGSAWSVRLVVVVVVVAASRCAALELEPGSERPVGVLQSCAVHRLTSGPWRR